MTAVTDLDDADRRRLARFADVLISGSPGWPSASEAEVHGSWMDRTFAARPDLAKVVTSVIAMPGEPREILDRMKSEDAGRFHSFSTAVAGTYLMNPGVRTQYGLPAGQPEKNPPMPDESDYYLEGGLLDPVVARGSAGFRRTPGNSA